MIKMGMAMVASQCNRSQAGIRRKLAPALCFFKSASGEASPVGGVRGDLEGILVAAGGLANEGGGDFGLLDEILGCASAEVDDAGA